MQKIARAVVVSLLVIAGCQQNKPRQEPVWDLRNQSAAAPANPQAPAMAPSEPAGPNASAREASTAHEKRTACKVRFRRDAVGLGSGASLPLMSDGTPNWPVAMTGNLIQMDSNWVVIESNNRRYSIPASAILMIEWLQ